MVTRATYRESHRAAVCCSLPPSMDFIVKPFAALLASLSGLLGRRPAISASPIVPPFPYGLTGWLDYDRANLPALNDLERIDYFEARVRRVFIGPLRDLWIKTGKESTTTSLLIVGMTASCGIE